MIDEKLVEVANELIAGCREGRETANLSKLYADNAVSVEAVAMPGSGSAEAQGIEAIQGKHEWWNNAFEVHSQNIEGPFFHGENKFSAIFEMDATDKQTKERSKMREVAQYTLDNGKIVREEFFYTNEEA